MAKVKVFAGALTFVVCTAPAAAEAAGWGMWGTDFRDFAIGNLFGGACLVKVYSADQTHLYAEGEPIGAATGGAMPNGVLIEHVAIYSVSTPGGMSYGFWVTGSDGYAYMGGLGASPCISSPTTVPLSWIKWMQLPTGASNGLAMVNSAPATLYTAGIDGTVWANTSGRKWTNTNAGSVVTIGYSPSFNSIWVGVTNGVPFHYLGGGDWQDMWAGFAGGSYCGGGVWPANCVEGTGGAAMLLWNSSATNVNTVDQYTSAGGWSENTGATQAFTSDLQANGDYAPGSTPATKILEGGLGPVQNQGEHDVVWVLLNTEQLWSYEQ